MQIGHHDAFAVPLAFLARVLNRRLNRRAGSGFAPRAPVSEIRDLLLCPCSFQSYIIVPKSPQISSRRNMQNETTGQISAGEDACSGPVIG
jgi:hypothetical protein